MASFQIKSARFDFMLRIVSILLVSLFTVACSNPRVLVERLEHIPARSGGHIQNYDFIHELSRRNIATLKFWAEEIENRKDYGIYTHVSLCEAYMLFHNQEKTSSCLSSLLPKLNSVAPSKLYLERFEYEHNRRSVGKHVMAWPSHIFAHAYFLQAKLDYANGNMKAALDSLMLSQEKLKETIILGGYKPFYLSDNTINLSSVDSGQENSEQEFKWPTDSGTTETLIGQVIGISSNWQRDFFAVPIMGAMITNRLKQDSSQWLSVLETFDPDILVSRDGLSEYEKAAYLRVAYATTGNYEAIDDSSVNYFDAYNDYVGGKSTLLAYSSSVGTGAEAVVQVMAKLGSAMIPVVGIVAAEYQEASLKEIHRLKLKQGLKLLDKLALALKAHHLNKVELASSHYQALLSDPFAILMPEVVWQAKHHYARLLFSQRKASEAVEQWKESIRLIDQTRKGGSDSLVSILSTADSGEPYQHIVHALIQSDQLTEAFRYMEKGKSQKLMDALVNVSLKDKDQKLVSRFNKLTKQLQYYQSKGYEKEFESTLTKISKLDTKLKTKHPALYDLLTAGDAELATVQSKLSKDESLLAYYEALDHLYAFVIHHDSIVVKELDNSLLETTVKAYRDEISKPETLDPSSVAYQQTALKLYKQIFLPIEGDIKGRSLTVVPHGALHYLPFNALYDGQNFLIERFSLRNLPTSSALVFLVNKESKNKGVVALGNPTLDLPAAELEARLIAMQTKGQLFLRNKATETSFKEHAKTAKILHVASHGEFNPEDPLASRILLAPDAANDGSVTARELYSMELDSELITLSGCETGLGDLTKGDDMVGLSRALIFAGAQSIVTSLWKVEDQATTQLMIEFYGGLNTTDRVASLRDAQLKVKNEYEEHPFFWAAFQLTGLPN